MIPFMRYLRVVKLIETEKYTEMSERQKQWLPGAGRGGGWEVTVYWVDSFSFTRWKWVIEMDVGDDCITVWIYLMPTEYLKVVKMANSVICILSKFFLKLGKKNQTLKRRPILLQKFSFSFLFEQYSISGGFHLLPRKCFPHTEDFQIASYSKSQLKKIFWWSQINVVKELISYRL